MEVISAKEEKISIDGKEVEALIYCVHIKISDLNHRAGQMIRHISDMSWIDKLGAVERLSFEARAERTVIKLVKLIKQRSKNKLTEDFGEFLVSDSAQDVLVKQFDHIKVPLAELLKEKVSGNPGFDFHTESASNLISFGEAKYSGTINPHGKALSQIVEFIDKKKDEAELVDLQHFVTSNAVDNFMKGRKSYSAAFSINSNKPNRIMENALTSEFINKILDHPEIYLVGVEVDA